MTDRLTFGVKRLVFEVWPAAGASQQARPVEIHCAAARGLTKNVQRQTPNTKRRSRCRDFAPPKLKSSLHDPPARRPRLRPALPLPLPRRHQRRGLACSRHLAPRFFHLARRPPEHVCRNHRALRNPPAPDGRDAHALHRSGTRAAKWRLLPPHAACARASQRRLTLESRAVFFLDEGPPAHARHAEGPQDRQARKLWQLRSAGVGAGDAAARFCRAVYGSNGLPRHPARPRARKGARPLAAHRAARHRRRQRHLRLRARSEKSASAHDRAGASAR